MDLTSNLLGMSADQVAVGFVVALNYRNPFLNPYEEFQMAIAGIARGRKLLNDDAIVALAESSWEMLDVSGSDVTDFGLSQLVMMCKSVRAIDISRCSKLTPTGVSELLGIAIRWKY